MLKNSYGNSSQNSFHILQLTAMFLITVHFAERMHLNVCKPWEACLLSRAKNALLIECYLVESKRIPS